MKVKTQSFHQKFLEDERRRRRLLEDEVGRCCHGASAHEALAGQEEDGAFW